MVISAHQALTFLSIEEFHKVLIFLELTQCDILDGRCHVSKLCHSFFKVNGCGAQNFQLNFGEH